MELTNVKDAFVRVAKRQKLCDSRSQEVIDQVGHELELALANIKSIQDLTPPDDQKKHVLTELKTKLNTISPHTLLEGPYKELNSDVSKSVKLLDKLFASDISQANRIVDFDTHTVNGILVNHFYRVGLFDIADSLVHEAAEPDVVSLRSRFVEMHHILNSMRAKKLDPAIYWASTNHENLKRIGSDLELELHGLQFVEILKEKPQADALKYARTCLAPFATAHLDEVKKLMGCLLYAGKIEKSPYSELVSPTHWEKLTEKVARVFCNIMGQSYESPLRVALTAGMEGLPTLLKLAEVMAEKRKLMPMKQLPVPVELSEEFQFHSVFICPVNREQGSVENPPMLLPCGHALSKQSVMKLSKSNTRIFKCTYCSVECSGSKCRQIHF